MRADGTVMFLFIEHKNSHGWATSGLGHFLYDGLSWDERHERGARYRELLAPQEASSDLWQKYGIHGFIEETDAKAVLAELRERHPNREFRLRRRIISQLTMSSSA